MFLLVEKHLFNIYIIKFLPATNEIGCEPPFLSGMKLKLSLLQNSKTEKDYIPYDDSNELGKKKGARRSKLINAGPIVRVHK